MIDIGPIQKSLDEITDFINQEGKLPDLIVDELNSMLYALLCHIEVEITKQKMIEKRLSGFMINVLRENCHSNQVKQTMYETLLG